MNFGDGKLPMSMGGSRDDKYEQMDELPLDNEDHDNDCGAYRDGDEAIIDGGLTTQGLPVSERGDHEKNKVATKVLENPEEPISTENSACAEAIYRQPNHIIA